MSFEEETLQICTALLTYYSENSKMFSTFLSPKYPFLSSVGIKI